MTSVGSGRERAMILEDLESHDEEVRRLAVERLDVLPSAEAIPRLITCLGDPGWRVRKSAVARLVACAETELVGAALISALGDGESPGRRNSAVEALVGRGESVVQELIRSLGSDDVDVRKLVVDALAGIGSEIATQPMIATLEDPDPNVRAAAADALGVIGGNAAEEALAALVVEPAEDVLVAFSALRALARLEVPMRAADVERALDHSTLRPAAYGVLGRRDDPEALDRLLKGAVSGSRASAQAAIDGLLRLLSVVDDARADAVSEQIRECLRGEDERVDSLCERLLEADLSAQLVLVQFLGIVGTEACVLPILRAGRDEAISEIARDTLLRLGGLTERVIDEHWPDLDVELQCAACRLLGSMSGELGSSRLQSVLEDADAQLRAAAASAIGSKGDVTALPALVRRLRSAAESDDFEAEEEVDALITALVSLSIDDREEPLPGAAEVIEQLMAGVEDAGELVRLAVARVMGRIGRAEDVEIVVSLLKDANSGVRRAVVDALARLAPETAEEPLLLALGDESAAVRVAAATALGSSPHDRSIENLRRLLIDEDEGVRAAAVRAIGAHSRRNESVGEDLVGVIAAALEDSGVVAMAAIEALSQVGGPSAASACASALERPEPELVQAAARCIGEIGDREAVGDLIGLVVHESWSVRAEAIQMLAERRVVKAIPSVLRRLETEQDTFVRDTILRALKRLEE